jgi:glycosyltransferase involved in cell wall biosynthesis
MDNKSNIAIVVPGGIEMDESIPSLIDLLYRLSEFYHLRVYSFSQHTPHPILLSGQCSFCFPPKILEKNRFLTFLYFLWRIRTDHRKLKFIAVHGFWVFIQGLTAVIIGKLLHIHSLLSLPGGDIVYLPSIHYGSMSHPVKRMIVQWCIQNADHVIVLTQYQKNLMDTHRISSRHVSVIPYGVDMSIFTYFPLTPVKLLQFVFIGNLNRVKDPCTLVKAFSLLNQSFDCRLTMIGEDFLDGSVQNYARDLGVGDKIEWKGKIPYEQIPGELRQSDFLLLTSRYEGEAVVVMEAFASGVVVVGTNVGLLADAGDERVMVLPEDAEGLVKKIKCLLEHPHELSDIRLRNRAFAEVHTSEWTCATYRKLYDEKRE